MKSFSPPLMLILTLFLASNSSAQQVFIENSNGNGTFVAGHRFSKSHTDSDITKKKCIFPFGCRPCPTPPEPNYPPNNVPWGTHLTPRQLRGGVEAFLKADAKVNARNKYGWTPLHRTAAESENPAGVKAFLGPKNYNITEPSKDFYIFPWWPCQRPPNSPESNSPPNNVPWEPTSHQDNSEGVWKPSLRPEPTMRRGIKQARRRGITLRRTPTSKGTDIYWHLNKAWFK